MIAMPVKMAKSDSAISSLFGKAKYFALYDEKAKTLEFVKNDEQGGRQVVEMLKNHGVDTVIFQQMGGSPFMLLHSSGIRAYHVGEGRVVIEEALERFYQGGLIRVTAENMADFVEKGRMHTRKHERHQEHEHGNKHEHHYGDE